jgi:hypothetical protein
VTGIAGEYGGKGWRVGELSQKEAPQEPKVDPDKVTGISQGERLLRLECGSKRHPFSWPVYRYPDCETLPQH